MDEAPHVLRPHPGPPASWDGEGSSSPRPSRRPAQPPSGHPTPRTSSPTSSSSSSKPQGGPTSGPLHVPPPYTFLGWLHLWFWGPGPRSSALGQLRTPTPTPRDLTQVYSVYILPAHLLSAQGLSPQLGREPPAALYSSPSVRPALERGQAP